MYKHLIGQYYVDCKLITSRTKDINSSMKRLEWEAQAEAGKQVKETYDKKN